MVRLPPCSCDRCATDRSPRVRHALTILGALAFVAVPGRALIHLALGAFS
jgi:hypothetical protein